ncbi:hypothetical protein GW17_00023228 [Ensete ventricosum]|nr:hypothetical protein GW17_00023228 [Ensete ventricosum]
MLLFPSSPARGEGTKRLVSQFQEDEEEKKKEVLPFPASSSPARHRRSRVARVSSSLVGHPPAIVALAYGLFFSCMRIWNVSPYGEKDRGDIALFF